jgi:orotate phosphoribosyltransferase
MTRDELAKRIFEISNLKGIFLLRSGVTSHEYFDKYLFEADPVVLKAIAFAMSERLPSSPDALAGLELGGVPIATMLSQITGVPALFVRKAAKEYGTCKLAEGGSVEGKSILIIEDVVTSGGAILQAVSELRELGAMVSDVVCVIDRESGGSENLAKEKLTLRPLFTMTELKASAGVAE